MGPRGGGCESRYSYNKEQVGRNEPIGSAGGFGDFLGAVFGGWCIAIDDARDSSRNRRQESHEPEISKEDCEFFAHMDKELGKMRKESIIKAKKHFSFMKRIIKREPLRTVLRQIGGISLWRGMEHDRIVLKSSGIYRYSKKDGIGFVTRFAFWCLETSQELPWYIDYLALFTKEKVIESIQGEMELQGKEPIPLSVFLA